MRTSLLAVLSSTLLLATQAEAFTFDSIDGGTIDLDAWTGQPVLVVNTASLCGFTYQYAGLQELYDTYRDEGLVVLGVPSDDFRQELGSETEVKEFCELNYGLDFPMTTISDVRGGDAHPFYKWVKDAVGFEPNWNFNKVLISGDGEVLETYGSNVRPMSREVTSAVEAELRVN
ncbi:glutathione peroxidase [Litoreibacter roseus]